MPTLYKRKDSPHWWMTHQIGEKQVRVSTGIPHNGLRKPPKNGPIAELMVELQTNATRRSLGLAPTVSRTALVEAIREYLIQCAYRVRTSSLESYRPILEAFQTWAGDKGVIYCHELKRALALQWLDAMNASGLAPATIKLRVATLRRFVEEAGKRNYLDFAKNPFSGLEARTESNVGVTAFTPDELERLLSIDSPSWLPVAIRISLFTGARLDSIKGLEWSDIGWEFRTIHFRRSKTTPYTVPMPDALVSYLAPIQQDTGFVLGDKIANSPAAYTSNVFARAAAKVGVKGHFHQFRHTFSTKLVLMGIDRRSAQILCNHESAAVHDHYTHVEAASLRPMVAGMAY